eukprot:7217261-Pyramimonas_sp.AAC.1
MSAHPHIRHTFRGPIRIPTQNPKNTVHARPPHQIRHAPRAFRGPVRNSNQNPRCTFHVRPPHPCRHTPRTLRRSPVRSSTQGASGTVHMLTSPSV